MSQTCVMVLGMHRSGTSALTGVLNILDISLGKDLLPGNVENEKGFFENVHFMMFNEYVFQQIGTSWDDVFFSSKLLERDLTPFIEELKTILQSEFSNVEMFAIKDPRNCLLFPIYARALDELNIKIKIVLPYRNPIEVAQSLETRNNFSHKKSFILWAVHFILAEYYSRPYDRVFQSFNTLLENPKNLIDQLSTMLNLDATSLYNKKRAQIDNFLESGLRHHQKGFNDLEANTPKVIRQLVSLISDIERVEPSLEKLDEIRNNIEIYKEFLFIDELKNIQNVHLLQNNKQENTPFKDENKHLITFISDPLDTDNFTDLTLSLLSPISSLKDFSIRPLLKKISGNYQFDKELLEKSSAIIVYDKGAIFSHLFSLIKDAGIPLIFYVNTNIWKSQEKHFEKEYHEALQEHYSKTIRLADSIITPNNFLKEQLGIEAQTLTPFIDPIFWKQPIQKRSNPSGKLTVAIYTDYEYLPNIPFIIDVITTLQERYQEHVDFVVYALNCNADDLRHLSFMNVRLGKVSDYNGYVNFIRSNPVDIVLYPLLSNEFNQSKTPFAYFEHSLSKIPGVYSDFGLFKETVKQGKTGFLCPDDTSLWIKAVSALIEDSTLRENMADAAEKDVRQNFSIDNGLVKMHQFLSTVSVQPLEKEFSTKLFNPFSRYDIDSMQYYQSYIKTKNIKASDIHLWNSLSQEWSITPTFHYFMAIDSIDANTLNLLANSIDSFTDQIYPDWKLHLISNHDSPNPLFTEENNFNWVKTETNFFETINQLVVPIDNSFIGILHLGEKLLPQALCAFCDYTNKMQTNFIYSDHDYIDETGLRNFPSFKPDINLEMLRSTNYIEHSFVMQAEAFKQLNGFDSSLNYAEIYDLILRYIEVFGEIKVEHYSEVLYSFVKKDNITNKVSMLASKLALTQHLQRQQIPAEVVDGLIENTYRILYHHEEKPLVSILIPTKNQYTYIHACIESIINKTSYKNYEIIIVDNNSDEKAACNYLESLKEKDNIHVIDYDKPFNYSTVNNVAAKQAKGDYLLLLNNDTEVLHENWLDVMMSHAQREDVGIVGARLLYPDNTIQHAGVIIGLSKSSDHPFHRLDLDDDGYLKRLKIDQEYSAVTAAALLIKKSIYNQVGALNDIDYTVNFSDVDLCLNVKEKGYKVIWTPHATLLHHGSITQKNIDVEKVKARNITFTKDENAFISKWRDYIIHDPAYNINLDTANSYMSTRIKALPHWNSELTSKLPKVFGMARAHDGGGLYRITSPLSALDNAGYIQSAITYKAYIAAYITRTRPDIIIYQTPMHDNHLIFLEYVKTHFPEITLIFEIDDLLTNIPIDNRAFHNQYKDSHKRIQKALRLCDKMVVSTEPLKDAFSKYAKDIRVIPNCLSKDVWGNLTSLKNTSEKLRVGWAGSIFHKGDLAIIKQLVIDFKDDVDWVFFGMCPEGMENIVEFHPGVALDDYPQKLASLNLDLALVPLEQNAFNEAKSNLRLLEFGILGWPIICTDIYPYQNAPVTRVKNRYKDWKRAFENKLSNASKLTEEGDLLKQWVIDNYILENNLENIAKLYLQ